MDPDDSGAWVLARHLFAAVDLDDDNAWRHATEDFLHELRLDAAEAADRRRPTVKPTPEARAAAAEAFRSSQFGGYESVQAVVDAVWSLGVAEGRQWAIAALRDHEAFIKWAAINGRIRHSRVHILYAVVDYLESLAAASDTNPETHHDV